MKQARIIVCERTGKWAAALRLEFTMMTDDRRGDSFGGVPEGNRLVDPDGELDGCRYLRETRSRPECLAELALYPASFVVVELTSENLESVAAWLMEIGRRHPLARTAVVADRDLAEAETVMRECGACAASFAVRDVTSIAAIGIRHLAALPRPKQSPRERIWSKLPWKRFASSNGPAD